MTRFEVFAAVLKDLGTPVRGCLLDMGCGDGALVEAAIQHGIDAYGCDFDSGSFVRAPDVYAKMTTAGRLRPITPGPYKLPFESGKFDVVISDQVMEHVLDYPKTLAEMARVMKPGGCCLHMFPSRTRLVEAHTFVPLAGVIRSSRWLLLWARLGIRNKYQAGHSPEQVAEGNANYLSSTTNYLSSDSLRRHFREHFDSVQYAEAHFLRYSKRGKWLRHFPSLYRLGWSRIVYARKAH